MAICTTSLHRERNSTKKVYLWGPVQGRRKHRNGICDKPKHSNIQSMEKGANDVKEKMVKFIGVLLVFIVVAGWFGVSYIHNKFMEPYEVAESFVEEAKQKKSESVLLIDEDSWEQLKNTSTYKHVRDELVWNEFVDFINRENIGSMTIGPIHRLEDKIIKFSQEETQVDIYTYDRQGNEIRRISLVMVKVDNEWKVAGTRR